MKLKVKKISLKTCIALKQAGFPQHHEDRAGRKYFLVGEEEVYRPPLEEVKEWFQKQLVDDKKIGR